MKKIIYKDSEKYGLIIWKESLGYTVMMNIPVVKVRRSHGKRYPQFFNKDLDTAYDRMIKWIENEGN